MKTSRTRRLVQAATAALAVCFTGAMLPQTVHGGNTWDGGGGDANWSTAANWDFDTLPGYGTLTFSGSTQTTNIVDANTSMNMLLWTGSSTWTLNNSGGAVISLYDNGGSQSKIENQSSGLVTINAPVDFAATAGAAFGEINAVNGDITFGSGTLTVSGSVVNGLKFWGGSGRTVTFDNTVSATGKWLATTGAGAITIGATGSVTAADIFVMNGGALNLAGTLTSDATKGIRLGGDFGATGDQDLSKSGTLNLTTSTGGVSYAGIVNSVGSNTSGALAVNSQNTSGTNTLSGAIILDSNLTISQAAGGTLELTTGGIDLKALTLTLTSGAGSNINASGVISNSSGSGSLGKGGAGTLTLSGNNSFGGGLGINEGVVQAGHNSALGGGTTYIGNGGPSFANINATLLLNASGLTVSNQIVTNKADTGGGLGTGIRTIGGNFTSGTSTFSGTINLDGGAVLTAGSGGTVNFSGVIANGIDTGNVSRAITVNAAGGTVGLSNTNTYTGGTTLTAGTLSFANGSLGTTGAITMNGGTLQWGTGNTQDLSARLTMVAAKVATFDTNGNNVTLGTAFGGATSGGLTKSGAGILTLSGVNTFTGKSTINGGTISIAADTGLGTAPGSAVADQLTLNGGTLKVTANSITLNANRGVTLGASGGTFDFSGRGINESFTVGGVITGTGALTLASSGDMTAGGGGGSGMGIKLNQATNTYIGDTTITSGLVTFANNLSFGDAANKIILNGGGLLDQNTNIALSRGIQVNAGGGTIRLWGTSSMTWSSTITGSGTINRTDGGTLVLSGDLSGYSGAFNVQGGRVTLTGTGLATGNWTTSGGGILRIGNGGTTGDFNTGTLTNNGTLEFGRISDASTFTTSKVISGTGTIAMVSGNVELTGAITTGTLNFRGGYGKILTLSGSDANSITNFTSNQDGHGTLILNKTPGVNALSGTVYVGNGYASQVRVYLGNNNQIADTGIVSMGGSNGGHGGRAWFDLMGYSETIAGIQDGTSQSYVRNMHASTASVLTLAGTGTYTLGGGYLYNGAAGTLGIAKTGSGTQTFVGGGMSYTGATTLSGGTLILRDTTSFGSAITLSGTGALNSERTALGFASRSAMLGANVSGTGTLNINNSGIGVAGGWTHFGVANGLTMAGIINVNTGVLTRDNTSTNNINTTATVNVAANGVLGTRGGGVIIGALNGAGRVAPLWSGSNATTLTVGNGDGTGSFSGIISGNGSSGTDGDLEGGIIHLVKMGTGTQTLTGTSTYTGATTITAGTLGVATIGNGGVAGSMGAATTAAANLVFNGGGLQYTGITSITNRNFTINTGKTATFDVSTAANNLILTGASTSTNGALTKTGAGILTLAGTNLYTGGTTVTGGLLIGTGTSVLGVNSGLTLNGGNFAYNPTAAGALNLGSGVLNIAAGSRIGTALGGTAGQSAITSSGAAVTVAGTVTVDIYGIPGVAPASGSNNLITAASGLNTATYTLGNIYNASNFTVGGLSQSDTAVSITATAATALSSEFWKGGFSGGAGVWALSDGSSASNWASDAAGTVTSLTPGTTSAIYFSSTGATNQSAMTLGANMSVYGMRSSDTTALILNADGYALTTGLGGITVNSGAAAVTLGSGLNLATAQTWANYGGNALTMSGLIANNGFVLTGSGTGSTTISGVMSGTGGLNKTGSGTLTLSGTNTYTGTSTVNGGTLALGNVNALAASTLDTGYTGTQAVTFTVAGNNTYNLGGLQGYDDIAIGANTISIGATNASTTYSGAISGASGNVTKTGTGTFTLAGTTANTFTGTTTVSQGNLVLGKTAGVAAIAGNITMSTTGTNLWFTANNQLSGTGVVSTFGANTDYARFNLSGTTQTIAGASDTTGRLIFQNNESPAPVGSGVSTLIFNVSGANSYSTNGYIRNLGGTLSVVKNGTGTQIFSGSNIRGYTGGTTVNAGTLMLASDAGAGNSIIAGTATVNATGTLNWSAANVFGYNANSLGTLNIIGGTVGGGDFQQHFYKDSGTLNINMIGGILRLGGVAGASGNQFRNAPINVSSAETTTAQILGVTANATIAIRDASTMTFNVGNGTQAVDLLVDVIVNQSSGAGAVLKTGLGTMQFTKGNDYTGATTISAGELNLNFSATGAPATNIINTTANTSALSLGGGTLSLTGKASTTNSQRFASTAITAGANNINLTANVTANPLVLTLGAITRTGGTVNFTLPTGTQSATNGVTTTSANDATGLLGSWATVGGADFATVSSGNIIAYTGYTDLTRLSSGTKIIPNTSTANLRIIEGTGTAANLTLAAATTTINTLLQSASGGTGAATIDPAGQILQANTILVAPTAGALTIGTGTNNGTLQTATASGSLTLINNSANTFTINSIIANNTGASTLTKAGSGLVILTGANSYTGATNVGSGTLQIGGGGTTGSLASTTIVNNGTLSYSRSDTIDINATISGGGAITANAGAGHIGFRGTISAGSVAATSTYATSVLSAYGSAYASAINLFTNITTTGNQTYTGVVSIGRGSNATTTLTTTEGGSVTLSGGVVGGLSGYQSSNTLTIDTSAGNGAVTLGGTTLTYGVGNLNISSGTATTTLTGGNYYYDYSVFNSNVALTGNTTFQTDGSRWVRGVTYKGNVTGAFTLTTTLGNGASSTTGTGTAGLIFDTATTQTVAPILAGTSGPTKTGIGVTTFSGVNTYTGVTTLTAGTLSVATIGNGGVAGNLGQAAVAATNLVFNGGTLQYTGATASTNRGFTINTGKIATFEVTTNTLTVSGASTATNGILNKTGAGTLILSGVNLHTGGTTINQGELQALTDTTAGAKALLGSGLITANSGTTLRFKQGSTPNLMSYANNFALTNATFSSDDAVMTYTGTMSLTGSNTINVVWAGKNATFTNVISGSGGFTKTGSGDLIFTSANSYTGATNITSGNFFDNYSLTSAVTIGSGAALVSLGGSTTSTLNLDAGSMIFGTASSAGAGTMFRAAGAVTAGASVFVLGSDGSGTIGSHTIDVVGYGTSPGTANFSTAKYHSATVADDIVNDKITLTYTNATRTWNRLSDTWDVMNQPAWQEGDLKYADGDAVVFDDTGFGAGLSRTVNLNTLVAPGSITFNNAVTAYTVSSSLGGGSIIGAGSLTKTGAGMVTLSTANSYTGGTTISDGQLQIRQQSALGTGAVTVNSGGMLSFGPTGMTVANNVTLNGGTLSGGADSGTINNTLTGTVTLGAGGGIITTGWNDKTLTVSGAIGGAGNLIIDRITSASNAPNIYLTGANNYLGTTTISNGSVLYIGNGGSTGTLGSGDVINNSTLNIHRTGTYTISNAITGSGVINVRSNSASTITFAGSGQVTGSALYIRNNSGNGANVIFNKTANSNAIATSIVYIGSERPGIYGASTTLSLAASEQIADTSIVYLEGTRYGGYANFQLLGNNETIGGLVFNGPSVGGGTMQNGSATTASTLTINTVAGSSYSYVGNGTALMQNGGTAVLNLIKNGLGTQALQFVRHTGTTTVNAGILRIQGGDLNSSATTVAGGTLDVYGSTVNAAISGTTGLVTVSGGTNSNFGGGNKTYTVDTVISGASTVLTQTVANSLSASSIHTIGTGASLNTGNLAGSVKALTGAGGVNLAGAAANLTIADGSNQIFSGIVTGAGKITKAGGGTQIFSGANNYTGGTEVTGGLLVGTSTSALGTNSGLTLSGGIFAYNPAAAGALNLGTGVLNFAAGSRIGTALGGTASQSAITSTGAAVTVAGTVTVDIYGIPGVAPTAGSNDLITAGSGLNTATYTLGNVYNATNFTVSGLTQSATAVSITAAAATALTAEYWVGGFSGSPGVWAVSDGSATSNWASDAAGTATSLTPGSTATVYFSASGAGNQGAMTLGANMSVLGIVVNDAGSPDTAAVTLNADGNTLVLGTGGTTVNSGAGAVTLGSGITLGGAQSWTNNSGNALTVSGNVANGGYLLTSGGTGNTTISGILSGTGGLTKADAGTLTLSGINTFTGNTIVTGGQLQLGGAGQLNSGAYAGTIALSTGTSLYVNSTAAQTLSGVISGAGELIKNNTGTLNLSNNANSFTGDVTFNNGLTTLSAGALGQDPANTVLGASGAARNIFINNGATLEFITNSDQIGNASTANQRTITVAQGGTLKSSGGVLTTIGNLVLNGGTVLAQQGRNSGSFVAFQLNGSITVGGSTASSMQAGTGAYPDLSLSNVGTRVTSFNVADATGNTNADLIVTSALNNGWSGTASSLTKTGAGTMELSAANTFSGSTRVETGTLKLSNDRALQNSQLVWDSLGGTLDYGSRTALYFGGLHGAQDFTMQDSGSTALAMTLGGGNQGGTFTGELLGGTTLTKVGTGTQWLGGSGSNTYTGITTIYQGALGLAKTGGATALGNELIFDNNLSPDVYTTFDNQFASGTIVSFVNDAGDHGRLELLGTTQTVEGIRTAGYNTVRGIIQNQEGGPSNTGNSTLVIDGSGIYSFNGYLRNSTGTIGLTMNGTGTQILSGAQITYTGPTAVNNGQLMLLNATAYNSATTVASGAKFSLNGTADASYTSTTANVILNNGGTLEDLNPYNYTVYAGAISTSGSTTINLNRMTQTSGTKGFFLDGGLIGTGTVTINVANAGSAVEFRNNKTTFAGTLIVNGIASATAFAGSGIGVGGNTYGLQYADITLNGTMELLASGIGSANTASGAFKMGALGGTGVMVGNHTSGGTTTVTIGNTNNNGVFSGVIANGTGNTVVIVKAGTGTQTFSGTNTYTGATTVNDGVVQLDFAAGGTSNIISASSALALNGGILEIKGGSGETNTQTFNGMSGLGGTLKLTQNGATSINATVGAITATGLLNFAGSNATVGALGSLNFLTSTTTTNNNGTTRLGTALWNGSDWASTSSTGGNHVVKWVGTYTDLTTDGNSVANPTGELRILDGTATGTAATYGANTTINSLLMAAPTYASKVNMGTFTLTVGNGAGATGVVAIADIAQSLFIGTVAEEGFITAGTSAAASILAFNNASATSELTVNSVIKNNASAGVVSLLSAGNVTLAGTNTYTGTTTIADGTLTIGGAGKLGSGTYAAAITNNGTLKYASSAAQTLNGVISGTGSLLVDRAGTTLTFGNINNTFTGGVTVNAGTLKLGSTNNGISTIKGVVTVNAGGTLDWNVLNAFGYNAGSITALNINGGTVGGADLTMHYYSDVNEIPITMTGGILKLGGPSAVASANQFRNAPITVIASANQAQIQSVTSTAVMAIRDGTTQIFNVGNGSQAVDLKVDVVISQNGSASGVTKNGAGTMELSKANAYTGNTRIYGGSILLSNSSALGGSTLDYNSYGGTVDFGTLTSATFGGLNGNQNLALLNNSSAAVALTVGANTATYSGVLSGTGATFTKSGSGTQWFTGAGSNTYTGKTTLGGTGQLVLAKTGGAVAIAGDIDMSASGTRSVLSTLQDNQFGSTTVMRYTVTPGDTRFELRGTTQTLAGLDSTGFAGTYAAVQHSELGTGTAVDALSTLVLNVTGVNAYTFGNTAGTAVIRNQGGTLELTKTGTGTQTLLGTGITYTGATRVNEGKLALTNTTGFNSAVTIASGATLEVALTADWTVASGVSFAGSGTLLKTGASTLLLGANNYSTTMNLGSGGLIDIQGGKIKLDYGYDKTSWSTNLADMNIAGGATFDLWDYGQSTGNFVKIDALNGAGAINRGISGSTAGGLEIGVDNGSGSFSGIISNGVGTSTMSIRKSGTGTQVFSGNNSYSGSTTVVAGALNIRHANALGDTTGATTVNSGAALEIQGTITTAAEALTLNGTGVSNGGALRNVLNNNTYAGLVTLGSHTRINSDSGTLTLSHTGTITGSGKNLTVGGAGDTTINSIIGTGSGSLTKDGAGTVTLNAANTYTGATTISAGTLALGSGGSFANSTIIVVGDTGSTGTVLDTTAQSGFTISSSQTLKGIGTVDVGSGNTLTIDGTHAAGNSVGLQSINGHTSYTSTAIFAWDISANLDGDSSDGGDTGTRGTNYDAVNINGNLVINSGAVFKVVQNTGVNFSNGFWDTNQSWTNIWNVTGSITSGWSSLAVSVYDTSNMVQDVSTEGFFTISGTSLNWTAVPEPSSAMAGLLIGAGLLRRRRKSE